MEQSKDKLLTAASTIQKKDSKDRDVLQITLNETQVVELLEEVEKAILAAPAKTPQNGGDPVKKIKIILHTGTKEGQRGPFLSTFFFVKPVEEFGAAGAPGAGGPAKPARNFVPKKTVTKQIES